MIVWQFLALFHNLKFCFGFDLLALAKADRFEDNLLFSLLNFLFWEVCQKCVTTFFLYFSGKVSKSRLNLNHDIVDKDLEQKFFLVLVLGVIESLIPRSAF